MASLEVTQEAALSSAMSAMKGPFEWGVRDCCVSACVAFHELWGVDPLANFPTYHGRRGAVGFLRNFGGRDNCPEFIAKSVGLSPCAPMAGAIVSAQVTRRRWALGICITDKIAAFKADHGVTLVNVDNGKYWGPTCQQ